VDPPEYRYRPRAPIGFAARHSRRPAAAQARRRRPRRPFLLAANRGDSAPDLPLFADGDAVADRPPLRQHVIEKFVAGIDDDRAGGFLARVLDDVTPVLHRNRRLRVGQIGHQLPVAGAPASLSRGRQCSSMQPPRTKAVITKAIARQGPSGISKPYTLSPIFETEHRLIVGYRCYLL
jgi:hypothetical protein